MSSDKLNISNMTNVVEIKQLDVLELQILYEAIIENIKIVDNLFSYAYKY